MTPEIMDKAEFVMSQLNADYGIASQKLVQNHPFDIEDTIITQKAVRLLLDDGLVETYQPTKDGNFLIKLTRIGSQYKENGKRYSDFLMDKESNKEKQAEKEALDKHHKTLQIQELETRLKSLEAMQEQQKVFWQSGIERDNRQRWQFWLTLLLAGAGFLLGIINFVKDILLR